MTLNRTLSYAAGTMISVLTIVAAADAKPFSHGHAGGTGPNLGQLPNTTAPFFCDFTSPVQVPLDSFAGYVNISSVKRLVYNLQTSVDGLSTAGISDVLHPFTKFTSIEFDISGYEDSCNGPWVFVTTTDSKGNNTGISACNVLNGIVEPTRTTGFTTLAFTPASFGLANSQAIGNFVIQLFPGTDGSHNDYINNVTFDNHLVTPAPRSLNNYCPLGFYDPRVNTGCSSGSNAS